MDSPLTPEQLALFLHGDTERTQHLLERILGDWLGDLHHSVRAVGERPQKRISVTGLRLLRDHSLCGFDDESKERIGEPLP